MFRNIKFFKILFFVLLLVILGSLACFYKYLESAGPLPNNFLSENKLVKPSDIKLYNVTLDKLVPDVHNEPFDVEKNDYTFSFIIPVHNTAQYLEGTVESITSQNIVSYEIIMVENNSTDNSLEICKKLAHQNSAIKVITQTNGGAGGARNTGLLHARGKYILYLDSDDFYEPNALNESEILKLKEYDIILFGYNEVDVIDDTVLSYRSLLLENMKPVNLGKYRNGDFFSLQFIADGIESMCSKVFKRKFLIENQIFFPNQVNYEDYYTALRVAVIDFKAFAIDKPLFNYRVNRAASQSNAGIQMYDIFYVLESFEKYLKHEDLYSEFQDGLFFIEFLQLFFRLHKIPMQDAYQWLKFMHERYAAVDTTTFHKGVYHCGKMRKVVKYPPFFVMVYYVLPSKIKSYLQ